MAEGLDAEPLDAGILHLCLDMRCCAECTLVNALDAPRTSGCYRNRRALSRADGLHAFHPAGHTGGGARQVGKRLTCRTDEEDCSPEPVRGHQKPKVT